MFDHSKAPDGTFFNFHKEPPVRAYEFFKLGMWIFLATEVLFFGGLFAAYFIFKYTWPEVFAKGSAELDVVYGGINTIVLLGSSYTMALAVDAAQRKQKKPLFWFLVATFGGACLFLVIKYIEWKGKIEHGFLPGTDLFFGVYFMTTGLHLIHVLIGMYFIGLLIVRAKKGRYTDEGSSHAGVEVGGLYWHLVDIIWIFLFPLLYLLGGNH
ncbi:Cytochrome c oxidase subunit 3 family protein [Sulfidibacter corallicola]|uniref:Cytochrome c oxidase subunit 3 family protein n=1 Tax=Sulfidibacter corallicola TaxID=2818388 RepID=A0A8A4TGK8_SULCO|nr:cytochrome c oxidase subunit 3 family protein [Sulfidibacter corallicola]QTD47931.1 cytochrome c oxidase subunit 3 family protein [Sulfidibacter corallicola]